ncbi:peptidoglycan-binding domain-containing protein [Cellulosimicrobium marinum]|uniref:peptidoglycan-binding domain-containing protein n=1 Tax=Cellulosimicrobium marinum TaxID=1638992 RepID=UPI001E4EE214|nr:peptidoglycan-binding protein [Cellulosimicrobium marinum]MCB7135110.1 peptidoglycan-binding protein [Cellulosimicrobium marinum]
MLRRPGPPGDTARHAPARPSALPWGAVVAGAGAVTLVVTAAGMVGAATGGPLPAVVTGDHAAEWQAGGDPTVLPRPDEPRPVVTRIPPPAAVDLPVDRQDDVEDSSADDAPAPGASEPPVVAEPEQPPSSTPTDEASPTPRPTPTPTPDEPTTAPGVLQVTWLQERLRAHGADVAVTGSMDDATRAALSAFREAHGLVAPEGDALDDATRAALAGDPTDAEGGDETTAAPDPVPPPSTSEPTGDASSSVAESDAAPTPDQTENADG